MKRKWISLLSVVFALVCALAVITACGGDKPDTDPNAGGAEVGEYYVGAGNSEYLLTLSKGLGFTLTIAGDSKAGSYSLDGEALTLTPDDGDPISATYRTTSISLTYQGTVYTFLKKIDYTVKFETNGGTKIADRTVCNGKTTAKPDDPVKDGVVFVGWYTDSAFRNLFYFETPITANITLYARFEAPIEPEFTASFVAEGETFPQVQTVGHRLFGLPEPVQSGKEFAGWWVSQYGSAEKLSYRYTDQIIEENVTLYAVWKSDAPAVSVSEDAVSWDDKGTMAAYSVKIKSADGTVVAEQENLLTPSYSFDFTQKPEGDYTVEVTWNGNTATAYYKNRALARVTAFEVKESTLFFNSVSNAAEYFITVECGTAGHSHSEIPLGSKTDYSFGDCEMKEGGITFVVTARAEGYVESVSPQYSFERKLEKAANLSVDQNTEIATWDAVTHAAYYNVSVSADGKTETFAVNANSRSVDLKHYASGEIRVSVTAVARGWNSSEEAETTYLKPRIASPSNVRMTSGTTLEWDPVAGAVGYEVVLNGTAQGQQSGTSFDLSEVMATQQVAFGVRAASDVSIEVRAISESGASDSLASDAVTVKTEGMSALTYAAGKVTWDYVLGVETYYVQVTNGELDSGEIELDTNSYEVVFLDSGVNTIQVWYLDAEGEKVEAEPLPVTAYKVTLDGQYAEQELEPFFLAEGDPVELPDGLTRFGHTFAGWFTAPSRGGALYNDAFFGMEQDTELYAGWYGDSYKIAFNVGMYSDDVLEPFDIDYGDEIYNLPVPKSNDNKMAFSGWFSGPTGDTLQYTDEKGKNIVPYLNNSDTTFYAVWVEIYTFTPVSDGNAWAVSKKVPGINYVTEITIPSEYQNKPVTIVEDFSSATTIETINIPNTIRNVTLGTNALAFTGCTNLKNLNVYEVDGNNDTVYYGSDDGVLFYYNEAADGGRTELAYYPATRTQTEYSIPATVQFGKVTRDVSTIPQGAFYSTSSKKGVLEKVSFPATVSLIEYDAFYYYTALTEVVFEDRGTEATSLTIRESAFGHLSSAAAKITSIILPQRLSDVSRTALGNLTTLVSVSVVGSGAYLSVQDGENSLLAKRLDDGGAELVFFPKGRKDTEIKIPAEITSIGEYAFQQNTVIKKVTIPAHVTNIGEYAFHRCSSLATLLFEGTAEDHDLTIGAYAFSGYSSNGTSMSNAPSMTSVELPGNLVGLGVHAFDGTSKLTSVTIKTDRPSVNFANEAFLTSIATNPGYVTTLTLGEGTPIFDIAGVFGYTLATITIPGANPYYDVDEQGVVCEKDGDALVQVLYLPTTIAEYTIPATVTKIGANLFRNRQSLKTIVIHKNVTEIGDNAFRSSGVTSITFEPGGEAPLTIGANAFYSAAFTEIELPERLVSIGNRAFYGVKLKSLNIPKNVESLEWDSANDRLSVFEQCTTAFTTLTVDPENTHYRAKENVLYSLRPAKGESGETTYVEDRLLYSPKGNPEKEIHVPGTVTYVASWAFYNASGDNYRAMEKLLFEDSVKTVNPTTGEEEGGTIEIKYQAVMYAMNLAELKLPHGLKTMETDAFAQLSTVTSSGGNVTGLDTKITSLTIPNTVTSIQAKFLATTVAIEELIFEEGGEEPLVIEDSGSDNRGAFTNLWRLTTITLPARLTKVGKNAFRGVTGAYRLQLREIVFEGCMGELTIGDNAFYSTNTLTSPALIESVNLPEGTVSIGASAFYSAAALTSIKLPSTLKEIGDRAFSASGLEGKITIPASVEKIGEQAFTNTKLTEVVFEDHSKLTSIGMQAFQNLSTLESVSFGSFEGTFTIGATAFGACPNLSSIEIPSAVSSIGEYAFSGDIGLESVTFESGVSSLTSIGDKAFEGAAFTEFAFPEANGLIALGEQLFASCTALTTIHISKSISALTNVFVGCGTIQFVVVDPGNEYFRAGEEGDGALYDKSTGQVQLIYAQLGETFTFAEGTINVGASLLANQTEVKTLLIPASVIRIGANAFENMISLEHVVIGKNSVLVEIGDYAFHNCMNLQSINLEDANYLKTVGSYAFNSCFALDSVKFGVSLTTIGDRVFGSGTASDASGVRSVDFSAVRNLSSIGNYMFSYCTNLKEVILPANISFLGQYTFQYSGLETIDLSNLRKLRYLGAKADTAPAATASSYLFRGCEQLTKVILPTTVTHVGGNTFSGCTSLKSVEGIGNVELFGTSCFQNTGLESFTLSATVKTVGTNLFQNSKQLTNIVMNCAGLSTLPTYMFDGCSALETIDLSRLVALTSTGANSFRNAGLTRIDLSANTALTKIDNNTFAGNASLKEVVLPSSVTTFGTYVFQDCVSLEKLALPSGITSFGNYDFANCEKLSRLGTDPDSLEEGTFDLSALNLNALPSYFFDGCKALKKLVMSSTPFTVGSYAFQNCTNLTSFDYFATVTGIDDSAFKNTGLTSVDLSKNTALVGAQSTLNKGKFGNNVFEGCLELRTVVMPENEKFIHMGKYTFVGCIALESIDFSKTGITILCDQSSNKVTPVTTAADSYIFDGCVMLSEVKAPAALEQIGGYAFRGCTSLTSFDLTNITAVGRHAFEGCGVESLTFSDELTPAKIFDQAFGGMTNLKSVSVAEGSKNWKTSGSLLIDVESSSIMLAAEGVYEDGVLDLSAGEWELGKYALASVKGIKTVKLPADITEIGDYAFAYSSIETIEIPASVTRIGTGAFAGCENLSTVTFAQPEGAAEPLIFGDGTFTGGSVTGYVPSGVFDSSGLTSITLPARSVMGKSMFFRTEKLKDVTLSEGITTISNFAFMYSGIETFSLPESVTSIGYQAYQYSALKGAITIPERIETIGNSTFAYTAITEATFEGEIHVTDSSGNPAGADMSTVLYSCQQLTTVTYEKMTEVYAHAFRDTGLTTFNAKSGITFIGSRAFENTKITSITIPSTVDAIPDQAFYGCTELREVTIESGVTSIGAGAFTDCTSLSKLTIPLSVSRIGENAFNNWTANQTIAFEASRFVTISLCGVDWLKGLGATVTYNSKAN